MLCKNKNCKNGNFGKRLKFEPKTLSQVYCCYDCLKEDSATERYKKDLQKAIKLNNQKEKKKLFDSWKSHAKWIQDLQKIVNLFIRLRDKNLPCISCGATKAEDWHAGHYIATTYQYLRFNENNINKQCSKCNTHLRGNLIPYRIELIKKIGLDQVEKLENERHLRLEMSIEDIKEAIEIYKLKVKAIKLSNC
jgi:hypothetical protein